MDDAQRARLVAHGALVFLFGMLAGFPFTLVILGQAVPGDVRGWHMAHLEGILNGLMLFAVVAISPNLRLTLGERRVLVRALLITAWGNVVASLLGPLFDARGLTLFGGSVANNVMFLLFLAAVVAVLVASWLIFRGARARLVAVGG